MTTITSSSELICHPYFDLLSEIAEGMAQLEQELHISLYRLMLLLALDDDNIWELELPGYPAQDEQDATIADDDAEVKRLKKWTVWRKKYVRNWSNSLKKAVLIRMKSRKCLKT